MKNAVGYTIKNFPQKYIDHPDVIPSFDSSHLDDDRKSRHEKSRKAIQNYIDTKSLKSAAKESGISESEVHRLFTTRFAVIVEDGEIAGWRGLVRHVRLHPYTLRDRPDRRGAAGLFLNLLRENSVIALGLENEIRSKVGIHGRKLSRKTKRMVFDAFKLLCARIPRTEYPWSFNGMENQSAARASVYRHIDWYLDRHPEVFELWFGHGARGRKRIGNGLSGFPLAIQPFDLVQIDAHFVDVIGVYKIHTAKGPRVVPIRRIWIVVLLDMVSNAVLGYSVSFEEQVSGDTVERAIIHSQTPWCKRELSAGLAYEPYSGFPAGVIDGLDHCPIVTLQLDNFSSHYSNVVRECARKSCGFHVAYGALGAWWTNAHEERFFGVMTQRGIQPLSSSMGNGPQDPMRPVDPIGNAIVDAVDEQFIRDYIEVLLSEHNGMRGSGRADMRPLEIINNHLKDDAIAMLVRPVAPVHPSAPRLGWEVERRRVGGSRKPGNVRRPYVELPGGRHYTNIKLCERWDLIGAWIMVHTRRIDMHVEAFDADGQLIGSLTCGRGTGHVVSQADLKFAAKGRNREDRPHDHMAAREAELTKQAAKDAEVRPRNVSDAATELAKLKSQRQELELHRKREPAQVGELEKTEKEKAEQEASIQTSQLTEMTIDKPKAPIIDLIRYGRLRKS